LRFIQEPLCKKCGRPVHNSIQEYCFECSKRDYSFEYGRALFLYDDAMRKSIYAFKYKYKKDYARYYASEMARILGDAIREISPDVMIPVPIHAKRKAVRGYNQAELISRRLSKLTGIPQDVDLLVRVKNTKAQKALGDAERYANLKDAFSISANVPAAARSYKRVLLVDDIFTTGSTIEMCTRKLLDFGIESVCFVCLCIGGTD
jgi:ComF family protein